MRKYLKVKAMAAVAVFAMSTAGAGAQTAGNVAYQDKQVRITMITNGAVRLEYVPDGQFVDDKSFVAVNRTYPKVNYQVKSIGKNVVIRTDEMTLTYCKGSGKFTSQNLSITSAKGRGKLPFTWKPGTKDDKNLKGTYRTLDGYDGNMHDGKPMPIEDGLLSRNGWTFIDDSNSYLFDHSSWPWVAERPEKGQTQDWYFMAYGHDYKKALRDYTTFAGKVPLPPRFAFGYWWSRYWHYSDNDFRYLVNHFKEYGIPLDVLVIDMDWHYINDNKGGWTGYTWNRRLFPSPEGFLKWVKSNDLQVTLNIHPADGVKSYEEHYPEMAKWMGMNSDEKKDIPWQVSDKKFMQGWFETQLRPMEKAGIDFWWLDWQQWPNDTKMKDLSNTWWLNYAVFSDMERNRDTRPMLYHRWGGLGNHRYQIGFSGDAIISWASLNFQPYFNSTASNVLYSYWSHDIGGHFGADRIDPELYVRWMQFGMLSPILRTHSTKSAALNKEPWVFDYKTEDILRSTINQRYALAPYIYTMARKTHDQALPLCRPMYYDYADNEEAYDNKNEYMFGDQMLVYPITAPMEEGKALQKVWLPQGNQWYEVCSGTLLQGGQTVERGFHLDEYPLYVKAGSVIPTYEKVKNLRSNNEPITVCVYPGGDGQFTLYEDNGNDKDYEQHYATTQLTGKHKDNTLTITIGARQGNYPGMPANREYKVKVIASAVPQTVTVNGQPATYEYDGNNLSVIVNIPQTACNSEKVVQLTYASDAPNVADGLIGQFHRIQQNVLSAKQRRADLVLSEELGTMESTGRALTYFPAQFKERVELFRKNYANLPEVLKKQGFSQEEADKFLKETY